MAMKASSAVCTSSVGIFLLSFFRWGGFLTLPRAKPEDIAEEAIDLSFQKCIGDQCNGVAPANCESVLHLIFDRIGAQSLRGRGIRRQRHDADYERMYEEFEQIQAALA